MSIVEALTQVIDRLKTAKKINDAIREKFEPGSITRQQCETVEEHLFEALRLIDPD